MNTLDLELLKLRLSIVMRKKQFTFLNSLGDFQLALFELFKINYNEDIIENNLIEMEESLLKEPLTSEILENFKLEEYE